MSKTFVDDESIGFTDDELNEFKEESKTLKKDVAEDINDFKESDDEVSIEDSEDDVKEPDDRKNESGEDHILSEAIKMGYDPNRYPKDHPEYTSPKSWIKYGKLQEDNNRSKAQIDEFAKELAAFKKLEHAKAEQKIKEYQEQLVKAKADYDLDAYERANNMLNAEMQRKKQLEPAPQQSPQKPKQISDWEAKNQWIFDTKDPRTITAHLAVKEYNDSLADKSHFDHDALIRYVDYKLGHSAQQNPRRQASAPAPDISKSPKQKNGFGWSDLTQDEVNEWKTLGESLFNGDKKEFLAAVKASRRLS